MVCPAVFCQQFAPHINGIFAPPFRHAIRGCLVDNALKNENQLAIVWGMQAISAPVTWATPCTHCAVCGTELLWDDDTWVIDQGTTRAHERCIDWQERPFPFAWQVDVCRSLAHRLQRDGNVHAAHACRSARLWLDEQRHAWPHDAFRRLQSVRRMKTRLAALLRREGVASQLLQRLG